MVAGLVSIIIPCYNSQHWIGQAIQSALDQTYAQTETIVIDDGSSDDSLSVIQGFGSAVRWQTGPNRGACAARNAGLELARGEFVQFLDADDVLEPQCVERKIKAAHERPDACPCSDWYVVFPKGKTLECRPAVGDDDPIVHLLSGQLQTSSPLHRRTDLVQIGGFDSSLTCSQERDLHLRLAESGVRFRHLPESLHTVRRREGSVSGDYRPTYQHENVLLALYSRLHRAGQLSEARGQAISALFWQHARTLRSRKDDLTTARRYVAFAEAIAGRRHVAALYNSLLLRSTYVVLGFDAAERLRSACAALTSRTYRADVTVT